MRKALRAILRKSIGQYRSCFFSAAVGMGACAALASGGAASPGMPGLARAFAIPFLAVYGMLCYAAVLRRYAKEREAVGAMLALGATRGEVRRRIMWDVQLSALLGALLGTAARPVAALGFGRDGATLYPALLCGLGAIIGMAGTSALAAGYRALREGPKALLRGERAGAKRFWLRQWRRLPTALRGLFMDGRRRLNTFLCAMLATALLVCAAGVAARLHTLPEAQVGGVILYDAALEGGEAPEDAETMRVAQTEVAVALGDAPPLRATLICAQDVTGWLDLRKTGTGEALSPGAYGALVSVRMADAFGLSPGSEITVDGFPVVVRDVVEYFDGHLLAMRPDYYKEVFGEAPQARTLWMKGDAVAEGAVSVSSTQEALRAEIRRMDAGLAMLLIASLALVWCMLGAVTGLWREDQKSEWALLRADGFTPGEARRALLRAMWLWLIVGVAAGLMLGAVAFGAVARAFEPQSLHIPRAPGLAAYVAGALLSLLVAWVRARWENPRKGVIP